MPFIHLSPPSTFRSTATYQLASYLITVWALTVNSEYTVVGVRISESPATDMALTSNLPHCIPSICPENKEKEKGREGGEGELQLSANNGCLPQSRADTPEWLMEKLIMASWGWISERPEQLITTGDHETAHGVPILRSGVEAW